jgi:hypothetical protein
MPTRRRRVFVVDYDVTRAGLLPRPVRSGTRSRVLACCPDEMLHHDMPRWPPFWRGALSES